MMRTLFSASPFEGSRMLGQGEPENWVLIGTLSHKADGETLFDRTQKKYEDDGWLIVKKKTGRVLYAGTRDEVEETHIWACPPKKQKEFLGQVPIAGQAPADGSGRMTPYKGGAAYFDDGLGRYTYCDPAKDANCPPVPELKSFVMSQAAPPQGSHWAKYGDEYLRWPDCDPRYDANCPFPTSVITEQIDAVGVAQGFGGPGGGGFGFHGGPGGQSAGVPTPASGPITGPSIPCGPGGYGPTCAYPGQGVTILQNVYPVDGVLGRRSLGAQRMHTPSRASYAVQNLGKGPTPHGRAAEGHDRWYHPDAPCPPGYFRSSPGSPCVAPGDIVDNGENYFGNPWI